METDKNPIPNINLFPRATAVARFVIDRLPTMLPKETLATHGDHLPNRGAAVMLDAALDVESIQE